MGIIADIFALWKEWRDSNLRLHVTVCPFVATDGRSGKVVTVSNVGNRPVTILEVYLPVLDSELKIPLHPQSILNDKPLPCFISSGEAFRLHVFADLDDSEDVSLIGNVTVKTSTGQLFEGPRLY